MAIDAVTIKREGKGDGRYGDLLDVAEALAAGDYGSASNAVLVMARQSPLFQATLAELRKAEPVEAPA